jgi:hypothetical protein
VGLGGRPDLGWPWVHCAYTMGLHTQVPRLLLLPSLQTHVFSSSFFSFFLFSSILSLFFLLLNENQLWEGLCFFFAIFLLYVRCQVLSGCCKTHLLQMGCIVGFPFFFIYIFSVLLISFLDVRLTHKVQNLVPRHYLPLQLFPSIEIKSNPNGRGKKRHRIGRLTEHRGFRCPLSGLPFLHHTRRRDAWRHRRNHQGTYTPTLPFFFFFF